MCTDTPLSLPVFLLLFMLSLPFFTAPEIKPEPLKEKYRIDTHSPEKRINFRFYLHNSTRNFYYTYSTVHRGIAKL